ncbi:MAG: ribulose phosphate epimerase [Nannocystaceae bacterium]
MRRLGWFKSAALGLCGLALAGAGCSGKDPAVTATDGETQGGTTAEDTTGSSGGTTSTGSTDGTTGTGTGTATGTTTGTSSSTSETGHVFLVPMDTPGGSQCDPSLQDCPRGEKCTAVSMVEGEPWGTNVCVTVNGDGALGDPCDVQGGKYTGVDNCDLGFICLLTDADGHDGTCIEFCDGNMLCPQSGAECAVYNSGSLPICLANCDPLVQDCEDGQGCYPSAGGNSFICFKTSVDVGEGGQGDGCTYVNQCQPGLMCVAVDSLTGCSDPSGCCTPFCSVREGNAPCNPGEDCVPYFADGEAPPQYVDVGVCVIPA